MFLLCLYLTFSLSHTPVVKVKCLGTTEEGFQSTPHEFRKPTEQRFPRFFSIIYHNLSMLSFPLHSDPANKSTIIPQIPATTHTHSFWLQALAQSASLALLVDGKKPCNGSMRRQFCTTNFSKKDGNENQGILSFIQYYYDTNSAFTSHYMRTRHTRANK